MLQTKQLFRRLCSRRVVTIRTLLSYEKNNVFCVREKSTCTAKMLSSPTVLQRTPYTCFVIQEKRNFSRTTRSSNMMSDVVARIKSSVLGPTYRYPKDMLVSSGLKMYACCTELINAVDMINELNLPDTLNSWFLITELHIWLCMVRLLQENEEGEVVRDQLINSLWTDVGQRTISIASSVYKKKALKHFYGHLYNAIMAYDEGLLGDDKELAGAIWRILFEMNENADPEKVALMVNYVRKQVAYLDSQKEDVVLKKGMIFFHGLKDNVIEVKAQKRIYDIYNFKKQI